MKMSNEFGVKSQVEFSVGSEVLVVGGVREVVGVVDVFERFWCAVRPVRRGGLGGAGAVGGAAPRLGPRAQTVEWTQRMLSQRYGHAMAYDAARGGPTCERLAIAPR